MQNFGGLQTLWPYQVKKPDFSDLGYFSGYVLFKTKSVTPNFFCLFGNSIKKSVRGNFWARTSLKRSFVLQLRSQVPISSHFSQNITVQTSFFACFFSDEFHPTDLHISANCNVGKWKGQDEFFGNQVGLF